MNTPRTIHPARMLTSSVDEVIYEAAADTTMTVSNDLVVVAAVDDITSRAVAAVLRDLAGLSTDGYIELTPERLEALANEIEDA
jgi:hypothetical protein